jgi:hypothetical protein
MSYAPTVNASQRPIPGYPGYQVTNDGRVVGMKGGWLNQRPNHDGYMTVIIRHGGQSRPMLVHRLVALAWLPSQPSPEHEQVAHWDGNPTNNHASNLRWATRVQNEADKLRHGRDNRGERHGHAKLTVQQVREIRKAAAGRVSQSALALQYGVSRSAVSLVVSRRTWSHVPVESEEVA